MMAVERWLMSIERPPYHWFESCWHAGLSCADLYRSGTMCIECHVMWLIQIWVPKVHTIILITMSIVKMGIIYIQVPIDLLEWFHSEHTYDSGQPEWWQWDGSDGLLPEWEILSCWFSKGHIVVLAPEVWLRWVSEIVTPSDRVICDRKWILLCFWTRFRWTRACPRNLLVERKHSIIASSPSWTGLIV